MIRISDLAAGLLLLGCLSASAAAQRGYYTDEEHGFALKAPDKWTVIPVQIDEKWIVAKFLSNRTYETKSRDYTDYGQHKPLIQIIWFSDEARRLRVEEEQRGSTTYIAKNAPYQDYKDYLKRNLSEGYYFAEEEQDTEADVPCTKFQVKIEKSSSMKRRLTTWVFRAEDCEFAVECEVLEDHYEKLEPTILKTLHSFKLIERTGASGPTTGGGGAAADMWKFDRDEWRKLSERERKQRRKQIEQRRMEMIQEDIPEGWTVTRSKRYLVLSHGDAKFTNRLVDAAESFRAWLENEFDGVSDEYVMQGVIRVCADYDELRAYVKGSGNFDSFNSDDREIVTYQDKGVGNSGLGYGRLFAGMMDQYLYDKDPLIYSDSPPWLHNALYEYVAAAQVRGKRIEFDPSDYENETIRDLGRGEGYLSLKQIMGADKIDLPDDDPRRRGFTHQATRWLRYIMESGSRQKELKNFIVEYMKISIQATEAYNLEREGQVTSSAQTEEEEEARAKERGQYWEKRRAAIIEKINEQMDWSDETWAKLEKAFYSYLK